MDININEYKAVQLKAWCTALGLPSGGTKAEMALRLNAVDVAARGDPPALVAAQEHMANNEDDDEEEQADNESEEEVSNHEPFEDTLSVDSSEAHSNIDDIEAELKLIKRERDLLKQKISLLEKNAGTNRVNTANITNMAAYTGAGDTIPLNIIKDMIPEYDGGSHFHFWEAQVLNLMKTYKVNENTMRALITIKLSGKALKWLHSNLACATCNFEELLCLMKSAFGLREHKLMRRKNFEERKWLSGETFSEYYHEKSIMATGLNIEKEDMIDYIIEGIPSKHLREQAQLQCFENETHLLRAFAKIVWSSDENNFKKKPEVSKTVRCFNCNALGHYATACLKPKRQYGACYGCGKTDHQVVNCPDRKMPANRQESNEYVRLFKYIFKSENNYTSYLETLIDSGSPVSFLRRSKLPGSLVSNFMFLKMSNYIGINKSQLNFYGKICCEIMYNNFIFNVNLLVVPDESMSYDVVLGRDFLRKSNSKLVLGFEECSTSLIMANCEVIDAKQNDCEKKTDVEDKLINSNSNCEVIDAKQNDCEKKVDAEDKLIDSNSEVIDSEESDRVKLLSDEVKLITSMKNVSCIQSSYRNYANQDFVRNMNEKNEVNNTMCVLKENCVKEQIGHEVELDNNLLAINYDIDDGPNLIIGDSFGFENKQKLLELFDKCYVRPERPEDPSKKCEMKILLNDTKPFSYNPRRISYSEKVELQKILDEYLEKGYIKASDSEYASPIVLVKKKTGELRMCIDFRKLNENTAKDNYPLPLIDDLLDRLVKKKIFTKLDLKNGFFHVFMSPESIKFTSFVTPLGQYEFLRMPFGLKNAPSMFQRFVNKVFADLVKQDKVIVYMDDIMIASEDLESHMTVLEEVFKKLVENNLELRIDKCEFMQPEIKYLGYTVSEKGIGADEKGLEAIRNFPIPDKTKSVQSFLGLCSYFRRFVKDFSILAKPLYDLTRKNSVFKFGPKELQCFELLKNKLLEAPILSIYDPNDETELHTDASSLGFGAMLMQKKEDGKFHPIFYFSKRTTELESKYHSFELETLGIVYALKRFRIYLLGKKFRIITDCNSLAQTLSKKELNPRIARWALELQNFDYTLEHRKNERMQHVDALSRCNNIMVVESNTFEENLIVCQSRDVNIKRLQTVLEKAQCKLYEMRNGVIYRKTNDKNLLFYVPESMESHVLFKFHDEMGHVGIDKVVELISKSYWFPKLRTKVANHISNCLKCIVFSAKPGREEGFLHSIPKGNKPFDIVHVDHYGPIDKSVREKKHIFVVVDAFTKFVRLYCTKTTKTKEVINALSDYFRSYSRPKVIVSDRGSCFTSNDFDDFLKMNHVQHVKVATGSPQANGQVERINRSIGPMISKLVKTEEGKKWTSVVELVEFNLNNTVHRATGKHPSVMLFGLNQRGENSDILQEKLLASACRGRRINIRKIRAAGAAKQIKLQIYNKNYVDRKRRPPSIYKEGDYVMIKNFDCHVGAARKLIPKYKGPYKIAKVLRNDRYLLKDVDGFQQTQVPYLGVWAVGNIRPWINKK